MSQPKTVCEKQAHNKRILVNRLPPEVLSRVFILGNALASDRLGSNRFDRFKDRVVLVCCYWRGVALGTTQLWSHIVINNGFPLSRALVDILRAGPTCPLDIHIDFATCPVDYTHITYTTRSIQRLLTRTAASGATFDRWRSLRVVTRCIRDTRAILGSVTGQMLALETLGIQVRLLPGRIYNEGPSFSWDNLLDLFRRSPQLRALELTRFDHPCWKLSSYSPMRNITHLELVLYAIPTPSDFRSFLVNNPHIETLVVELRGPPDDNRNNLFLLSDTTSITLVRLQTLALVEGISGRWCKRALRLINAPNLTSFRLDLDYWPSIADCRAAMKFLCSDECTFISPILRHLSLGPFRCDSDEFLELFTKCPNLVRLDWAVEQNRTYGLMLSHSPWLLPKLSWMRISGVSLDVPLDYILSQTIVGRSDANIPLRVVEVHASDWANLHADVKSHLQGMVEKIGPFYQASEAQLRGVDDEDMDSEEGSDNEVASHGDEEWSDDG